MGNLLTNDLIDSLQKNIEQYSLKYEIALRSYVFISDDSYINSGVIFYLRPIYSSFDAPFLLSSFILVSTVLPENKDLNRQVSESLNNLSLSLQLLREKNDFFFDIDNPIYNYEKI